MSICEMECGNCAPAKSRCSRIEFTAKDEAKKVSNLSHLTFSENLGLLLVDILSQRTTQFGSSRPRCRP